MAISIDRMDHRPRGPFGTDSGDRPGRRHHPDWNRHQPVDALPAGLAWFVDDARRAMLKNRTRNPAQRFLSRYDRRIQQLKEMQ